ncbi:MAG: hypothetical protein M3Z41_02190 [Candidatus Eremiobacteraeota bacterium]|nr:hypothetical protein [Candidatus Eremiobacteraeota bacterium]
MRRYVLAATVAAAFALAACSNAGSEQKIADTVTRAVYNNDMAGVTSNFDSALAPQVTRASLGVLSDTMHKMGNFQGLTETATDLPAHRYVFDAKFDRGDMTVQMRLDPDGKVAAYKVLPGSPS